MDASPDVTTPEGPRSIASPPVAGRPVARWIVAIIAVLYGFAKLNGSQFEVLDSVLDRPTGSVSGFWLTWYYFGYSPIYGNLIAVVQIVGGLLVTHPRFALAGALLLVPVAANIVLVDIFYVIFEALLPAVLMLGLLLWIIAPHARRLVATVVPPRTGGRRRWTRLVAPLVLILFAFGFTYWTANHVKRHPTAVDGVWEPNPQGAQSGLERVFFEYNRAHMVVLKDTSGTYSRHHFVLEPGNSHSSLDSLDEGRLRIWEEWRSRGRLLFDGTFTPPDRIRLRPGDGTGEAVVELRRVAPPGGR